MQTFSSDVSVFKNNPSTDVTLNNPTRRSRRRHSGLAGSQVFGASGSRVRPLLPAVVMILLSGWIASPGYAAFETIVRNVNIDGQGTEATLVGATFDVSLDFTLWNSDSCPGCISQVVLGIDGVGQDCAYDGIPGTEPGVTGSSTVTLTAPLTPGVYNVQMARGIHFSCGDAAAEFPSPKVIGTIKVGSSTSFEAAVRNVDIDGQGTRAVVVAGDIFGVDLDYELWNESSCPGCISQIVIGAGNIPLYCVYDGIPGIEPGVSGSAADLLETYYPGTFELTWAFDIQYTCADALANFLNRTRRVLGTVEIGSADEFFTTVSNATIDYRDPPVEVMPGESLEVSLDYTLWNASYCPACISQIVLGIDGVGQACAYDGIPATALGVSGNSTVTLTAPSTNGAHEVQWARALQYTCADAIAKFPELSRQTLGGIPIGPVFTDGFESGDTLAWTASVP